MCLEVNSLIPERIILVYFTIFLDGRYATMFGTKWKHKDAGEFTHVFHVTKWIIARKSSLIILDFICDSDNHFF